MDGFVTLVIAFGALLLAVACAFFLFGKVAPAVRDWLVPDNGRSRALDTIGYTAALLAMLWTVMFIANHKPVSSPGHHADRIDKRPATASAPSSETP